MGLWLLKIQTETLPTIALSWTQRTRPRSAGRIRNKRAFPEERAMNRWLWTDVSSEAISEELIRAFHSPPEKYRISPNRYEVGTQFPDVYRRHTLYILSGSCRMLLHADGNESLEMVLNAGEVAIVPRGDHTFQTLGSHEVRLVRVWDLSTLLPSKNSN
jgi:hypothetical protein